VKHAIDPSKRILVYTFYGPRHATPESPSAASRTLPGFISEQYAPEWTITRLSPSERTGRVSEYKIEVKGMGTMEIRKDWQRWTVFLPAQDGRAAMKVIVEASKRTPWTTRSEIAGPEGLFILWEPSQWVLTQIQVLLKDWERYCHCNSHFSL
jgi:hypothetical protein